MWQEGAYEEEEGAKTLGDEEKKEWQLFNM